MSSNQNNNKKKKISRRRQPVMDDEDSVLGKDHDVPAPPTLSLGDAALNVSLRSEGSSSGDGGWSSLTSSAMHTPKGLRARTGSGSSLRGHALSIPQTPELTSAAASPRHGHSSLAGSGNSNYALPAALKRKGSNNDNGEGVHTDHGNNRDKKKSSKKERSCIESPPLSSYQNTPSAQSSNATSPKESMVGKRKNLFKKEKGSKNNNSLQSKLDDLRQQCNEWRATANGMVSRRVTTATTWIGDTRAGPFLFKATDVLTSKRLRSWLTWRMLVLVIVLCTSCYYCYRRIYIPHRYPQYFGGPDAHPFYVPFEWRWRDEEYFEWREIHEPDWILHSPWHTPFMSKEERDAKEEDRRIDEKNRLNRYKESMEHFKKDRDHRKRPNQRGFGVWSSEYYPAPRCFGLQIGTATASAAFYDHGILKPLINEYEEETEVDDRQSGDDEASTKKEKDNSNADKKNTRIPGLFTKLSSTDRKQRLLTVPNNHNHHFNFPITNLDLVSVVAMLRDGVVNELQKSPHLHHEEREHDFNELKHGWATVVVPTPLLGYFFDPAEVGSSVEENQKACVKEVEENQNKEKQQGHSKHNLGRYDGSANPNFFDDETSEQLLSQNDAANGNQTAAQGRPGRNSHVDDIVLHHSILAKRGPRYLPPHIQAFRLLSIADGALGDEEWLEPEQQGDDNVEVLPDQQTDRVQLGADTDSESKIPQNSSTPEQNTTEGNTTNKTNGSTTATSFASLAEKLLQEHRENLKRMKRVHETMFDLHRTFCPKDHVCPHRVTRFELEKALDAVGLDVRGYIPEPVAILEAYAHTYDHVDDDDEVLVVDLGANYLTLSVLFFGNKTIRASRVYSGVGGNDFNDAVMDYLGPKMAAAKREYILNRTKEEDSSRSSVVSDETAGVNNSTTTTTTANNSTVGFESRDVDMRSMSADDILDAADDFDGFITTKDQLSHASEVKRQDAEHREWWSSSTEDDRGNGPRLGEATSRSATAGGALTEKELLHLAEAIEFAKVEISGLRSHRGCANVKHNTHGMIDVPFEFSPEVLQQFVVENDKLENEENTDPIIAAPTEGDATTTTTIAMAGSATSSIPSTSSSPQQSFSTTNPPTFHYEMSLMEFVKVTTRVTGILLDHVRDLLDELHLQQEEIRAVVYGGGGAHIRSLELLRGILPHVTIGTAHNVRPDYAASVGAARICELLRHDIEVAPKHPLGGRDGDL